MKSLCELLLEKYKNFEMESMILKRTIGYFYFGIFFIIATALFTKIIPSSLYRFIFCCNCLFLGLAIRACIYHGIFMASKKLNIKETFGCLLNYVHYGIASIAVCGFIYFTLYEQIEKMDYLFFRTISIPFFTYSGFAVVEVILPLIRKRNE